MSFVQLAFFFSPYFHCLFCFVGDMRPQGTGRNEKKKHRILCRCISWRCKKCEGVRAAALFSIHSRLTGWNGMGEATVLRDGSRPMCYCYSNNIGYANVPNPSRRRFVVAHCTSPTFLFCLVGAAYSYRSFWPCYVHRQTLSLLGYCAICQTGGCQ